MDFMGELLDGVEIDQGNCTPIRILDGLIGPLGQIAFVEGEPTCCMGNFQVWASGRSPLHKLKNEN